ncbi:MAG: protein kinase [Planctomycetaceae bacterium]
MKLDNWQQHEPILLAFEDAWATCDSDTHDFEANCDRATAVPILEDFAGSLDPDGVTHEPDIDLLTELVMIDFEHRCRRSLANSVEYYFQTYPQLRTTTAVRDELLRHEFQVRNRYGTLPDTTELESRFAADSTARDILNKLSSDGTLVRTQPIPPAQLQPGAQLGPYTISRFIASGSFATVYLATDSRLKRSIALKILRHSAEIRPEIRMRLQREAQAIASIRHPNIVPVFETGTIDSHDFIATHFVDGDTLADSLKRTTISAREATEIVRQLASALKSVHQLGIIHRDIKPANIMIENGVPLLLDFGLAMHSDSSIQLTHEGDLIGTPAFMPPEQADGRGWQADPRSDLYSLGAVLFRMVCGRLPFEGSTSEVISKVLHQEVRIPAECASAIDRDLQTIILKCLEKEPRQRYQTAEELEQELSRFLNYEPIRARRAGIVGAVLKWARRRPALAVMTLLILISAGFLTGVLTQLGRVSGERDVARDAKRETQGLLAESAASAGQLAMQRGRIKEAVRHFEQSLVDGQIDDPGIRLQLIEASLILGDVAAARQHLQLAKQAPGASGFQTELRYWQAELALETNPDAQDAIHLFHSLPMEELHESDRHYIHGVVAETSAQSIEHFQNCLLSNPFHFRARRMMILTQMALAQLTEASQELRLAIQLFPEDTDFRLMHALCLALTGQIDAAQQIPEHSDLHPEEREQWLSTFSRIASIVANPQLDSGLGELSVERLRRILVMVADECIPLFAQRRWRLPPQTRAPLTLLMQDVPALLSAEDDLRIEVLESITEIHPEASLLIALGGLRLLKCNANPAAADIEIPQLLKAREAYRKSLLYPGFLKQDDQLSWKAIFTISTILSVSMKHEVEDNLSEMLVAAEHVKSESIGVASQARTFTIMTLNQHADNEAGRWIERWLELASEPEESWQDAVWHKAVLCQHQQRWSELIQWCDRLMKVNPHYPELVPLRDFAIGKLREVIVIDSDRPD